MSGTYPVNGHSTCSTKTGKLSRILRSASGPGGGPVGSGVCWGLGGSGSPMPALIVAVAASAPSRRNVSRTSANRVRAATASGSTSTTGGSCATRSSRSGYRLSRSSATTALALVPKTEARPPSGQNASMSR